MLQLPDPAQALTALQKIYFNKGMIYSPHLCQCDRQSGLAKGVCHLQSLQRLPRPSFTGVQKRFEEGGMGMFSIISLQAHVT